MHCKQWIFDMDGTLTDSMVVVWEGAPEALHRLGGTSPAGCAVCEDAIYAAQTAHDAGFYLVGIQDVSSAADAPALRRVCDQFLPDWTALDWAQV